MSQRQKHSVRVPQVDLASLLGVPNPEIDLRLDASTTSMRNFIKAVTNYKTRTIASIADKRASHATEKKSTIERIANVEAETNDCKIKEIQLVADLQREQEERKDAEISVSTYKRQLAALRDRCAAIDSQIEHYRVIAGDLGREKKKEREKLRSLATQSGSECEMVEARLGCVVEGVDKDQLLVRMTQIDPSDPSRDFKFVLDVGGESYRVLTHSPPLSNMPFLVARLHESRDLFSFIRDVRGAYVDMVSEV
ncbi:chromosome segregation protein Spc25-domain-containing protein [Roridomyces roridus]|uniref:Kinetochore protein SPC25 n=1 Tax=Roridomyces roridus TaxID=1738132 RepID=A0AAD7CEY7_9AGAR|nr:chromosome segregation protein Spc25-domain-containing protein [Roridomyces roridus]